MLLARLLCLNRCHLAAALLLVASNVATHATSGDCFEQTGTYQGVDPTVLHAIVWFGSEGDAGAIRRNADGSVDIGQAQINSTHFGTLARYDVPRHALTDACVNVFVTAWLLKQKMVRHGNIWRAIGAYHSETPAHRDAHARSTQRVLISWGELRVDR